MKKEVSLTADMVVLTGQGQDRQVLLIQRGWPPFEGMWALPGGYVEIEEGEQFKTAALRELAEETGIHSEQEPRLIGVYDDPMRDPRGRVITVAFLLRLPWAVDAIGGDDATVAKWMSITRVRDILAFDHNCILHDAIWLDTAIS